jgi:hypothetical protein
VYRGVGSRVKIDLIALMRMSNDQSTIPRSKTPRAVFERLFIFEKWVLLVVPSIITYTAINDYASPGGYASAPPV